jgi:hypothetical protein
MVKLPYGMCTYVLAMAQLDLSSCLLHSELHAQRGQTFRCVLKFGDQ